MPAWLTNLYFLHVLIVTGIFIIAAMSLNLLLGYTGQLSLGHVAFFGIGAYTSALVSLGFEVHLTDDIAIGIGAKPVWFAMLSGSRSRACAAGPSAASPSRCAAPISSSSRSASPRWCGWSRSTGSS